MKLFDSLRSFFTPPPSEERPCNWMGFTEGICISLYVALVLLTIDLGGELLKKLFNINTPLNLTVTKFFLIAIFFFLFNIIHVSQIRKNKSSCNSQDKIHQTKP